MNEKFLLEAKLLVAIKHPNIVRLLAVHTTEAPYMNVMEFLGMHLINLTDSLSR